ncbi:integrase core domain-containing protein [Aminobacter sp. LjRoot7]
MQRHGISRLPDVAGDKPAKRPFKCYPIGYFHIDIAEVRTEEGKLHLFVAVDRTSKFAFARLVQKATTVTARTFLEELVEAVPYKIHTVLTDNGIQFADLPKNRDGPTASWRGHPFDRACWGHGIEHRLTKPNHPWTNGQVERMNRTLKEATVRRYHYETHRQLEDHLAAFLDGYNFARRLKTLRGLTPYEAICTAWANQPDRFRLDPVHLTSGLNT